MVPTCCRASSWCIRAAILSPSCPRCVRSSPVWIPTCRADVRSFEEVVQRSVAPQRFNAILLGIFSGLALLLATSGPLRGALVLDEPADFGDRAPRRAGREQPQHFGNGDRSGDAAGAAWESRSGAVGAWWLSRYFAIAAVRRQAVRHSHVCGGGGIAAGDGAGWPATCRDAGRCASIRRLRCASNSRAPLLHLNRLVGGRAVAVIVADVRERPVVASFWGSVRTTLAPSASRSGGVRSS